MAEAWDGAVLTDDMGTGKSVQAIELLEQDNMYPALIVCPKSAKGGWRREFAKWAPHRDVVAVNGTAPQRKKILSVPHDVYIMTWESLRYHSRLAPHGSIRLKRCVDCGGGDPTVKPAVCEKHLKELNLMEFHAVVADEAGAVGAEGDGETLEADFLEDLVEGALEERGHA